MFARIKRACGARLWLLASTWLLIASWGCASNGSPSSQDRASSAGVDVFPSGAGAGAGQPAGGANQPAGDGSAATTDGVAGGSTSTAGGQQGSATGTAGAGGGTIGTAERVFDAGSDPARNQVQAGSICARLSQIQCAGEAYCCSDPGRDVAACEAALTSQCQSEAFLDAISADPRTGFDAAAAATALAEIERLASSCDPSIASFAASPSGLMGMFRGTLEADASCHPGSVEQSKAAAALASCTNIQTTACLPANALSWSCKPRGGAGSPCFSDLNCQDGLFCPNPDFQLSSFSCEARKPAGATCTLPNECMSFFCEGGQCVEASVDAAYCLQ